MVVARSLTVGTIATGIATGIGTGIGTGTGRLDVGTATGTTTDGVMHVAALAETGNGMISAPIGGRRGVFLVRFSHHKRKGILPRIFSLSLSQSLSQSRSQSTTTKPLLHSARNDVHAWSRQEEGSPGAARPHRRPAPGCGGPVCPWGRGGVSEGGHFCSSGCHHG